FAAAHHSARAAADAHALVAERRARDGPALVRCADDVVVGHEYVTEEHLVEIGTTSGLTQRPHLDAGSLHVDHDRRDARVLLGGRVGAHGREAEVAVLRAARPHLLAVDDPAAVDARRTRRDAGRVGTGVGLAEQLAPHEIARERRLHPAFDLRLA